MTQAMAVAIKGLFEPVGPRAYALVAELIERGPVALIADGADRCRSHHRHPLTFDERTEMVSRLWPDACASGRLVVVPLTTDPYDAAAASAALQSALVTAENRLEAPIKELLDEPAGAGDLHRRQLVGLGEIGGAGYPGNRVPEELAAFVADFRARPQWRWLNEEFQYCQGEREKWRYSPHPPTFNTGDALVVHRGRVLFIRRGHWPGKGLLALPGGHVNPGERLFEAAVREAYEETSPSREGAPLPKDEFARAATGQDTFDEPWRDPRGRYFTRAFRFSLPDAIDVLAGDDAESVEWVDMERLDPRQVFADHYFIVKRLLAA